MYKLIKIAISKIVMAAVLALSQSSLNPLEGRVHGETMQGEESRMHKVHVESLPVCQSSLSATKIW